MFVCILGDKDMRIDEIEFDEYAPIELLDLTRKKMLKKVPIEDRKKRKNKYDKNYARLRYKTDPIFRRKILDRHSKYHKERYANDPVFRAKRQRRYWKVSVLPYVGDSYS